MSDPALLKLDTVIFGGGAAGLWLLDTLHRQGYRVLLLEAYHLGSGQTIASQGIIHGGLKYTLRGLFTKSADAIKQMPLAWRECLAGKHPPDLTGTNLRASFVYLWHTQSVTSRAGMFGAKSLLAVKPVAIHPQDWPAPLVGCTGGVYRLDEQVIDPAGFIRDLAGQHTDRILRIDPKSGLTFDTTGPGQIEAIRLTNPDTGRQLKLYPNAVIFTAGAGNADLRQRVGLSEQTMQRRPLHMVVARGNLPPFNGHCIDGNKTRLTITSDGDAEGHRVWQIGGQVAEDGVPMEDRDLVNHAKTQLAMVLGRIDLGGLEWATYRVDRAEAATANGVRPDEAQSMIEGNVITGWPTKLALAPVLAQKISEYLAPPAPPEPPPARQPTELAALDDWPRPRTALPPWEHTDRWFTNV